MSTVSLWTVFDSKSGLGAARSVPWSAAAVMEKRKIRCMAW
jgi:hypothetical protein